MTGVTHNLADGTPYTLASEVGLLERNIIIEGSETSESFGGRVLVSKVSSDSQTFEGKAQDLIIQMTSHCWFCRENDAKFR